MTQDQADQAFETSVLSAADSMLGVEAPPAAAPTPAEPTPLVVAPPVEAGPAPQPEVKEPEPDKLALLAKQEQEQRLEKWKTERLQVAKEREELEQKQAQLARFTTDKSALKEQLLADPVGFFEGLGLDPNQVATRTWKKKIGDEKDKASEEVYGVAASVERLQRELQSMKEEAARKETAATQAQQAESYKAQLVSALVDVQESLPHVKPFLEKRRELVVNELYNLAVEKHREDPDTVLSQAALCQELDARIASVKAKREKELEEELQLWRLAGSKPAPVAMTGQQNARPSETPTLSNQLAGATERKSAPQSEDERLAEAEAFVRSQWSSASP
jgi:hypothetical protein